MSKFTRVNLSTVFLICRCYGTQRSQPNHYETLCIKNDSTQKEIRDAFIDLSKKLHPDIGNERSHAKFVKVNEAYRVLSKEHTRKQYDTELKYQSVPFQTYQRRGQSNYDSEGDSYNYPQEWIFRQNRSFNEKDYYGIKGINRVSNGTIALICVLISFVIVSLQLISIKTVMDRNKQHVQNQSMKAAQSLQASRNVAATMTRAEQIEALRNKLIALNGKNSVGDER